jgi:hypothetical protein
MIRARVRVLGEGPRMESRTGERIYNHVPLDFSLCCAPQSPTYSLNPSLPRQILPTRSIVPPFSFSFVPSPFSSLPPLHSLYIHPPQNK